MPDATRIGGRPAIAPLTEADRELMDEQNWEDFLDWQRRRANGTGYLGEFNASSTMAWVAWLKRYCLKLRGALRNSRNATHIRELEAENARLAAKLAHQSAGLTPGDALRQENAELRRELKKYWKNGRG